MITEKEVLVSLIRFLESNAEIRERYRNEIEKFKQQLEQAKLDRYRLGVIGVTSSGKSTMINAIMKQNLLATAVQPSSSQLVTCSKGKQNQVTVYFQDKPPKVETGKSLSNIIKKYGDERSNPGNILHVKQLEVSTPDFAFPEEVLLIDSPGLDAYGYEGHEKLTMSSLLPTIDFCIFVTTCKTNSDAKMRSVLDIIADYDCPLIIVQNMIDALRPSPDGKKSVNQVAAEHRKRLERIVTQSKIKDKKSVHLIQISSMWALEAFTNKLLTQQKRKNLLARSNFNALVNAVNSIFDEIRPKIEYRRLSGIRKQVAEIVQNAQADLQATEQERKSLTFAYAGYDRKMESSFSSTQSQLNNIVQKLKRESESYQSRSEKFTEDILQSIISSTKSAEYEIIKATNDFRENITYFCNIFNIDARRLRVLDSFGAAPSLQIQTKTESKRVKKSGFGSGIARFFGGIFDTDWGYEYVSETVYDHEKTRESIIKYYDSVISIYSSSCDKWETSAQTQVNMLLAQYQNSYDAYEARKQSLLDKEKIKNVISSLETLMKSLPEAVEKSAKKSISVENPDLQKRTVSITLNTGTYAVKKIVDKICLNIHQSVFKAFTGRMMLTNCIVIGWDSDSIAMFVNQNFQYHQIQFSDGITTFKNMRIFLKPSAEDMKSLKQFRPEERYIFIIFNTAQFGSGLSEVSRAGLEKIFSPKDKVYFVVQDFAELITGEGIQEGIKNMLSIQKTLSLKVPYQIMLNHTNPVYNLLAGELQLHPCVTHTDEIALLNDIQQKFSYLRNPRIDKQLSEIIAGFRK